MAVRIHSVNQPVVPTAAQLVTAAKRPGPAAPANPASSVQTGSAAAAQAPSFTAVFAQIAAAAAAAGTTVASIAPAGNATAQASAATSSQAQATAAATDASSDPAGPLFGPNPWLTDPTGSGPNGTVTNYNPVYFATQQTAQTVAQMLGGEVVQSDQMVTASGSPFTQNQPNYMVQLPDGAQVNPGFIADIYSHGWNQSFIDQQVANEVAGAEAAVGS
jgi:hypothetical protein